MAERRETTTDGVHLSYLVEGEGAPVVLIAGLFMTAQWWVDDGYVEALAIDHRVIAVDPLGSGRSDRPLDVEDYTDERLVEHLAAVIESERARGCVLWGWGRGAMIAQLYARRRPSDISLVVLGGEYLGRNRGDLSKIDVDPQTDNEELIAALEASHWDRVWDVLGEPPRWFRERAIRDNDSWAVATVLRSGERRAHGFLPSSVPTVAMWGSDEPASGRNLAIAESLPIDVVVVPGDRFEAYLAVGAQMAAMRPHLERAAARAEGKSP